MAEERIHRIENRSPLFNLVGHAIATLLGFFFLATLALSIFQIDFWQTYFFRGTTSLAENAVVRVWRSAYSGLESAPEGLPFLMTSVPHARANALQSLALGRGEYTHAEYKLTLAEVSPWGNGLSYIHLGWVFAEMTEIRVNGVLRASYTGLDKPIIPLQIDDLDRRSLVINVLLVGAKDQVYLGLTSAQPPSLAQGSSTNARLMGLETALQNVRGLTRFLPLITLALVIIFGWFSGIRVRAILAALFYFGSAAILQMNILYADLLPFGIELTYQIANPLRFTTSLAFVYLIMEITKIYPRIIYRLMLYTVLSAIGGITFLVARPQDVITILVQATAVYQFLMILVLGFLTLKTAVDFRRRVHATSNRRLYLALIPLLAVMTLTFVGDLYVRHEGLSFWPSEYLELILPLFSAGILLYVLSQADRKYQDERQRAQTLETEMTIERARTDILSNFLSANLVQKFSDRKTMRENLREVLIPRPTRILVMQADIRGFSRITAQMDSVGMVQLLQSYYAQIVDTAQIVGQVKLIGDCIFLFVEESPAMAARDLADLGIELAALLSRETERLNEEARAVGNPVIRFGIAIHIGPAVVGNLSSNRCIDYTALGQNVNFVARLEELTKYPHVSAQVGDNGLIVSREASDALRRYSDLGLRRLDMDSGQVRVRSFEGTPDVLFLTAADLKKVGTGMLPTPTDGSKLR